MRILFRLWAHTRVRVPSASSHDANRHFSIFQITSSIRDQFTIWIMRVIYRNTCLFAWTHSHIIMSLCTFWMVLRSFQCILCHLRLTEGHTYECEMNVYQSRGVLAVGTAAEWVMRDVNRQFCHYQFEYAFREIIAWCVNINALAIRL